MDSPVRYVPQWLLPGGGFQKKARVWKENVTAMRDAPFDHVLGNMVCIGKVVRVHGLTKPSATRDRQA